MFRVPTLCLLFLCLMSAPVLAETKTVEKTPDPAGLWLTENKRAAIKLEHCGGKLCGKLAWIIKDGMTVDSKNPDEKLRGRALCNLRIISDFTQHPKNPKVWDGGTIYKADEGDVYNATISVVDANTLNLRGYVGVPLFGKSQRWTRVSAKDYPACKGVKAN